MNAIIFQFQSNFEGVFCVWYTNLLPYLEEKFRGLQFRGWEKDRFGKKKQIKAEQEKRKVLYWASSTVCSNCSNFKIYVQKKLFTRLPKLFIHHIDNKLRWRILLKFLYYIVSLLYWVEPFQTGAWNISSTKKIYRKFKGIVTRQHKCQLLKIKCGWNANSVSQLANHSITPKWSPGAKILKAFVIWP